MHQREWQKLRGHRLDVSPLFCAMPEVWICDGFAIARCAEDAMPSSSAHFLEPYSDNNKNLGNIEKKLFI